MAYKLGFAGSRANLWDCKVELLCRLLESWYIPTTWTQHFSTVHHSWFNGSNNPTCSNMFASHPIGPIPPERACERYFRTFTPRTFPSSTPHWSKLFTFQTSVGMRVFHMFFIGSNLFQCHFVWELIIEHYRTLMNTCNLCNFLKLSSNFPLIDEKKHHKWIQMGCPVSKPR